MHAARHNRRLPDAMRGERCSAPYFRCYSRTHIETRAIECVFYKNFSGWWDMASKSTVHLLRWERLPRTHPYHCFVYSLVCAQICPCVAWWCHTTEYVDGDHRRWCTVHYCRRWLTATVCDGKYVSFPQTAIIKKCRGHAANPYVKYSASSSSLLTRLGLMQTSSPCTFNAFITLAMAWRCYCASFFNGRASSQFTATLATTLLARDPRRGDHHSNWLCRARFSQFRNVAPSTWLQLWLDSRVSTYWTKVAQANPPVVFENSMSTIPLYYLSIYHTDTCQTVN